MLRRWLPLLAVAALLAAAFVAAVFAEPQLEIAPLPSPEESGDSGAGNSESPRPTDPAAPATRRRPTPLVLPPWIDTILAVGCTSVAVVVAALLLWVVVRDTIQARGRPIAVDEGDTNPAAARAEDIAAALDAGLAELSAEDSDPRRAVIACWVRLEQAAAGAGTPRRPSDAPADHVLRLLSAHQVSRPVLDRFAAVYRLARYGSGPVDEDMRATSVSALRQLRTELSVPASVPEGEVLP